MMGNPWQVESIEDFACLKCPECVFFCKEEHLFRDHALENHPNSFELFWEEFEEETKTNHMFNGKEIDKENLVVKDESESQNVSATSGKSNEINDQSLSMKTYRDEKSKSGEIKLKCPLCMGRYKDQQILNDHIRNAHDKSSQSQKLDVQTASSSEVSENFNENLDKLMLEEMEMDSEEDDQLLLSKYQNALKRKAENKSYYQLRKAKVIREQDQSVMSNLTFDSNKGEETQIAGCQIDQDFFKDHRIIPSKAQRVEVLTKIGAERDFLFGKLKYGVTRQKRDEYRERFLKWCHLRDIPFQTWKKVEDHYNQWKSTFKKNQEERERSGSRAQPLEKWEQVLELFEVEGQTFNSDKPKRTSFEIEMWGERSSIPDREIDSNKDLTDLTIDSQREKETYLDRQKCTICNACFPCRKNLYAHIRKYHQQSIAILKVNCPHCEDVFNSCKTLKRHHLTVHKGKVPRRPFTCTLCKKALNSIEKLHIHTSLHKGKKPYKCNICCINFKFKYNLHSHLRRNHDNNASENNPMSFELYWQECEENTNTNKLINDKEINVSRVDDEEVLTKNQNLDDERLNIDIDTNQEIKSQSVLSNLTKNQLEDERVFLSIAQREEVLEKIGIEREFLFGKLKYGVTRQRRDECRESFFKWCDLRGIPYQTWEKVEQQYYQWKSTFKKNQEERESGSRVKHLEKWEQLLELCELEGQVLKPEKPKRTVVENEICGDRSDHEIDSTKDLIDPSLISNLTIDSKSEKEIQVDRDQGNSKEPNIILTTLQREEVLSKIIDERHFLFGKIKDGVTREKKDQYRKQFMNWCKVRGIPYKTWKKVEENWNNWKSICNANQREREEKTGSGFKPFRKWLANCELEGQILNPDKPKRTSVETETWKDESDHENDSKKDLTDISNLTSDSKREKEIKSKREQSNSKDPNNYLTTDQREEVLSKIIDERCFLFGKLKDGVTREKRDESRKQFLKWCKVRGIPYKEWKKVGENWRNWKSMCFINQSEREKQTGTGVKPPERWEQILLENCEQEDSKPFECSICNQGYSSEVNLKAHIKKLHTPIPTKSYKLEKDDLSPFSLKCNTCKQFFPELLYKDHVKLCKQYSNNVKRTSKGYQCQICQHESSNLNKSMFDHLKTCLLEEELVDINSVPSNYILEHSDKDLDRNEKQIKTSMNSVEKSKVVLDNLNEKEAERKFQKYLSEIIDHKVKVPESKLEENISVPIETSNMTNMDIDIGLANSRNGDIMDVNLLNPNNMIIYSCFECPKTFDDTVKLNEHFMLMHDKKKNWEDKQIHIENEEPFQKINPSVQEEDNLTTSIASGFTVVEEPIERINQAIVLKYLGINSPNALNLNTDLIEQDSSNHEQKASQGFIQKITKTAFDKGELDPLDVSSDSDSKVWIF